jgi:predicted Rossmann-fold nucleotide-binding protein
VPAPDYPVLAVFASDRGPGDAARSAVMSQAGSLMARRGARLVLGAGRTLEAIPLVTGARQAGGDVLVVAEPEFLAPPALADLRVERIAEAGERQARIAALADAFVGLPGSLTSAAELFRCWVKAGGGTSRKPVILLNHHRAFEAVRGLAADILSHSVKRQDRMVVFTAEVEDLWNKINWALNEVAAGR